MCDVTALESHSHSFPSFIENSHLHFVRGVVLPFYSILISVMLFTLVDDVFTIVLVAMTN